jgi:hypothetical protein
MYMVTIKPDHTEKDISDEFQFRNVTLNIFQIK